MFSISVFSLIWCLTFANFVFTLYHEHDLKGFDDSILYKINWPGKVDDLVDVDAGNEPLYVTTNNKEKYKCMIPPLVAQEDELNSPYIGPGPLDLIVPLFSSSVCSYRIESYWTYEVCHGFYIRQYHEERDGKSVKTQEYFLGSWDKSKTDALRTSLEKREKDGAKYKTKKIDSLTLPYLEIDMTDGTFCELNNEHRVTKVLYVCYAHGKNEIYSLKETSTCNYEVIVLTSTLCAHPSFRPHETSDNSINCFPIDDSPKRPRNLLAMEVESMKLRYQKLAMAQQNIKDTIAVFKVDTKDGTLRMEIIQNDFEKKLKSETDSASSETSPKKAIPTVEVVRDSSPVEAFLQGKHCLTGGTGWWKYEFCYGRYVRQYHIDNKNSETSLILGFFNEKLHKEWMDENPHKKPKPKGSRTQLTHYYQGGTLCDKTGKKRLTEVKLKCLENAPTPSSVSLYLLEPQTCQYILGVESPLICDILQNADEYGLLQKPGNEGVAEGESPADGYIVGNAVVEDFDIRFEND